MSQRRWKRRLRRWVICGRVVRPDPREPLLSLGALSSAREAAVHMGDILCGGKIQCTAWKQTGSQEAKGLCIKAQPGEN